MSCPGKGESKPGTLRGGTGLVALKTVKEVSMESEQGGNRGPDRGGLRATES